MNYNNARETNYRLLIPGKEFEVLNYFITSVELPTVSVQGIDTPYHGMQCSVPSNTMTFDDLTFNFIVDEDYKNYFAIYNWLYELAHGNSKTPLEHYKDLSLHLLTNNKTELAVIVFEGAYPTSLGSLSLNSQTANPQNLTASVTVKYQRSKLR